MPKPAFIVDGFTEKALVQALCPGHPIIRTNLNGRDVKITAIVQNIAVQIRLLNNRNHPIVVLVDKEQRSETAAEIVTSITDGLREAGLKDQDIRVGVADRMLENWIAADWQSLAGETPRPTAIEGANGSALIKRVKGRYHKVTDGVELFLNANPVEMYRNSDSFRAFVQVLGDIECDFVGRCLI